MPFPGCPGMTETYKIDKSVSLITTMEHDIAIQRCIACMDYGYVLLELGVSVDITSISYFNVAHYTTSCNRSQHWNSRTSAVISTVLYQDTTFHTDTLFQITNQNSPTSTVVTVKNILH